MRAIQEKNPNKYFKKVVLLFESQEEIDKIHALLNHRGITDTLEFNHGESYLLDKFADKEAREDYHNLKLNLLFEAKKVKTKAQEFLQRETDMYKQIKWEDYSNTSSYFAYPFQAINTYNTNSDF